MSTTRALCRGKGLFTTDEVLFTDSASENTIAGFANCLGNSNAAFTDAMRKLGVVEVKTRVIGNLCNMRT